MIDTKEWLLDAEDETFIRQAIESAIATIDHRKTWADPRRTSWYQAFGDKPGRLTIRLEVERD